MKNNLTFLIQNLFVKNKSHNIHIMNHSIVLIFLLFSTLVFSQNENKTTDVIFENTDYFQDLQQEKLFIHTNKTTYFSGEKIWWKAYVVSDFSDKPITNTSNLYVNFYNSNKELITHQLFYCENGKANGEITLPSNLETGVYYINLDTQWNKNFKNKYIVPVFIINSSTIKTTEEEAQVNVSDVINITFYPESGSLLNNTTNTIFFSLQNNDIFLAEQTVTITDNTTNKVIANIKTNTLGLAKFNMLYLESNNYTATVDYKGKAYIKQLPKTVNVGVLIHKKESINNKTTQEFTVEFSKEMLAQYHENTFFATIHRNQKLLYVLPFKVNKKHIRYVLPIENKNLFNGVNTITLFNSKNQQLSERDFYLETQKPIEIDLSPKEITKDSIAIGFQLKNTFINTNLSISVLPSETKLNTNARSILDGFLLEPYINTKLKSTKNVSSKDLDMLLQTQTKNKVINYPIEPNYKFERGLKVEGVVNTEIKTNYKVLLSSVENEILETTEINDDKSFVFKNLVLRESSNYKLALLNEKGAIIEGRFYVYKQNENYKPSKFISYNMRALETEKENLIPVTNTELIVHENTEVLNEVLLQGQRKKEELVEENYPNNPGELGNGFTKKLKISELEENNLKVIDYLNNQSGVTAINKVERGESGDDLISLYIDRSRYSAFYGDTEALLLINGLPVENDILHEMLMSQVASVKVNASGAGYGFRGGNGVISIELKKGHEDIESQTNTSYFTSKTDFGFTSSNPVFEASTLVFKNSQSRRFYETLDWIPNFNVLPNKTNTLKIYKGNHENIKLFINGMNNQGALINEEIDIPIKPGL